MPSKPFLRFLTALLLLSAPAAAQSPKEMRSFFTAALRGESTEAPTKTIPAKRTENARRKVWEAWEAANAEDLRAFWHDPAPLSEARHYGWPLPAETAPVTLMPFYYGAKGPQPAAGYPLFLYLHGSGPKAAEWQTGLQLALRFDDSPSAYFIPQIPNEGEWYRWYQRSKQAAWERLLRLALLDKRIDPRRIYVFGISEGGYGSQRLASFYADYWAAAGPMAGGEPLKNAPAENLANTPLSLLTGDRDYGFYRDKLTRYTAAALDSLQALHPGAYPHRVELQPGRGHGIDYRPTTPWLARHTRKAQTRSFSWEDYEMDGRHRRGFYNIEVLQRPDSVLRTRYDLTADSAENAVRLTVRNVAYTTTETDSVYGIALRFARSYSAPAAFRLRLYLSGEIVDLTRPVRVYVNGHLVCDRRLRPNTGDMLRSVALFHDPLRVFPVSVEVNGGTAAR